MLKDTLFKMSNLAKGLKHFCKVENFEHGKLVRFLMFNIFQIRNYADNFKRQEAFNLIPSSLKTELECFNSVFPQIVTDLTQNQEDFSISKRFGKTLEYVVPHGKKYRGLTVVASYKHFEKKEITQEQIIDANILGWAVEIFQGSLFVVDDIVDNSNFRRQRVCWHKKEEVGLVAAIDAVYLNEAVFFLLQKYFGNHRNYTLIVNLFHEVALKTAKGQILDTMPQLDAKPNLAHFTIDRYKTICELKTAYYTFYLPIRLAMLLASFPFTKSHNSLIKNVSNKIGLLYQAQDDFFDCFGTKEYKGGSDICEGKCTWLAVTALQRATAEQKQIMMESYGISDIQAKANIKNLYQELNIPAIYQVYEEESFDDIYNDIQKLPKELCPDLFVKILTNFYKRQK